MNHPISCFRLGLYAVAFVMSGLTHAACYIGEETNATSAQADSGNGTYSCSLVSTSVGALGAVTSGVTWGIEADGSVTWSVAVNANGYPTVDVDLVSVSNNSGKRCNYTYSDQPAGGMKLSTSDRSTAKYVTVCADGVIAPEPPPPPPTTPEPFSTLKDQCSATFANAGGASSFDVAFGYSKQFEGGLYEGVAICSGPGQKQCINECVPRLDASTSCSVSADGTISLDCAQCEWDAPPAIDQLFGKDADGNDIDMKYCWYYENRVDEGAGTFKPSPKKKSLSVNIDVITGSNCYLKTVGPLYGGKTYSYWYCPTQ